MNEICTQCKEIIKLDVYDDGEIQDAWQCEECNNKFCNECYSNGALTFQYYRDECIPCVKNRIILQLTAKVEELANKQNDIRIKKNKNRRRKRDAKINNNIY